MSLTATQGQEIKLRNLEKNPGILPFKLGPAKIKSSSHIFLHFVELTPIHDQIILISEQYNSLRDAIKAGLSSAYNYALSNFHTHLKYELKIVKEKFNTIYPIQRNKRGLINPLGSLIKFISGNLDHNDAEKYDKAILELQNSQNSLIIQTNKQISLNDELVQTMNSTLSLIIHNQEVISKRIQRVRTEMNRLMFDFNYYMETRDILDQLKLNLDSILNFLSNLENAITFARLQLLHTSIMPLDNLKQIIEKLKILYNDSQLPFTKNSQLQQYYDIINVSAYFKNDKLIFVLSIPLVHPDAFSYYQLFSIPNNNNLTIIPQNSFFLSSEKEYQYTGQKCKKLPEVYFCEKGTMLPNFKKPDCIFSVIQKDLQGPTNCKFVRVSIQEEVIEEINNEYYITLLPKETRLQTTCKNTDFVVLKGNYLIQIPTGCYIKFNSYAFYNEEDQSTEEPLLLPEFLQHNHTMVKNEEVTLSHISLNELHKIQFQLKNTPKIPELHVENHIPWSIPFGILAIMGIAITVYLFRKKIVIPRRKKTTTSQEMQTFVDEARIVPPSSSH